MGTYFVGQYSNPTDPLGAPILIKKIQGGLTADAAIDLTRIRNTAAGHQIVDEVEIKLSHPHATYFMYDDEQ
jgi:hypothetical protein